MARLHYRIDFFGRSSLTLRIEEGPHAQRRILYLSTLKELAKKEDKPFLEALVSKKRQISSAACDTLSFNETELSFAFFLEVIPLLVSTNHFYLGNDRIESHESAKIYWEGKKEGDHGAWMSAFLWGSEKISASEIRLSFSTKGTWVAFAANRIFFAPIEGSLKWLEKAKEGPFFLSGSDWKRFLEEDFAVFWKEPSDAGLIELYPRLTLHDEAGSFASLEMNYVGLGAVAMEDPSERIGSAWRRKEEEKRWEKDLIDAGYMQKRVGRSSYYCPSERVSEALRLLLEIGWDVVAFTGRRAELFTQWDCDLNEEQREVVISGSPLLQKAFEAARNGRQWIECNDRSGWIDPREFQRRYGDLVEEKWDRGALRISKEKLSLCQSLAMGMKEKNSSLYQTLRQLAGLDPLESVLPDIDFQAELLNYQKKGLDWLHFLHQNEMGGLLADEMGLGKTVQVLAFFSLLKSNRASLIVVPTSLLYHWASEMRRFLPKASYLIYAGSDRKLSLKNHSFVLTSYALVRQDIDQFLENEFETIVLDESSAIKNPGAQMTLAIMQLRSKSRFCLCGTPVENCLDELRSQFSFLMPTLFKPGDSLDVLRKKSRPFLLRRCKSEVCLDLPEKIDQTVWIEMQESQMSCYLDYHKSALLRIRPQVERDGAGSHRMEILEAILRLRQICCDPRLVGQEGEGAKIERLKSDMQEWRAEGAKVLVFSQFTSMLDRIEEAFAKEEFAIQRIDGKKSAQERNTAVQDFQNQDGFSLLLLSLKAGGVGLNLTQADAVLLFDPWWNEAVENQAIDRAHRIGRKKSLLIKRYLTPKSIEEKMLSLKESKLKIAQALFDEELDPSALSESEYLDLLFSPH